MLWFYAFTAVKLTQLAPGFLTLKAGQWWSAKMLIPNI
jgi:hypothetical protein